MRIVSLLRVSTALLVSSGLVWAEGGPAPIRSAAQLASYLATTPITASPLGALSAGGRKRFLAQLQFTAKGLGSFSTDDPEHELTPAQLSALYALFGMADYAQGAGLTQAQWRQRQRERRADASARHCAPADCPESTLEQRYDTLKLHPPATPPRNGNQRVAQEIQRYDQLFGEFQRPGVLATLSVPDLRLLMRALDTTLYAQPDRRHLAQLRDDLVELQRRGSVSDADYASLYRGLLASRQFAQAASVRRAHPALNVAPPPRFIANDPPAAGQPTALVIDATHDTMRRRSVSLDGELRIVVIAGCHFSEDAARAIEHDARLRPLFADHSIWLASASQPLQQVAAWNRQFSTLPMHVAWQSQEWSMLDDWAMPTWYVFRHGKLTARFQGWQGVPELKRQLRRAGVSG